MRLVQLITPTGNRAVAQVEADTLRLVEAYNTLYELASTAITEKKTLEDIVQKNLGTTLLSYDEAIAEKRILAPADHPDEAHCLVTGTGLTHLGSAQSRDAMHAQLANEYKLTDSMKIFKLGLEQGKPKPGSVGATPEWFYKGDGACVTPPEQPLHQPSFALDGGEEAELVGVYIIAPDGQPFRLGYAIGNEFSDHVLEKENYLFLAHSKLRNCSFGPELNVGSLPENLKGMSRISRQGECIWEADIAVGEANMVHSLANLEHHHFKYRQFRRSGDLHIHFFGAAALSFTDRITTQADDVFEIDIPSLGRPLRNPLHIEAGPKDIIGVRSL